MNMTTLSLRTIAMACALCAATVPALAQTAQKSGSKQQSMATLKKEINAAYAQQKRECGRQAASERTSCLNQARQTYRDDMANAPQLVASAPRGSVTERVVSTTTSESGGTTASATGSSQGGATGSSQGGATGSAGMEAGAAATGSSSSGSSASGSSATGSSGTGITASGEGKEMGNSMNGTSETQAQPMQPPSVATPPRSEDAPVQR